MNGFDFLLLGILMLTGGAILIVQGRLRSTPVSLQRAWNMAPDGFRLRQLAVRHAHNKAGACWLTIGAVAFVLAVTRGRDTMFLVEYSENVLMPLTVLMVALVITSARADRVGRKSDASRKKLHAGGDTGSSQTDGPEGGRFAPLKRTFTIARARTESAPPAHEQPPAALSHIMQCPEDSFWKEWQNPPKRPEA